MAVAGNTLLPHRVGGNRTSRLTTGLWRGDGRHHRGLGRIVQHDSGAGAPGYCVPPDRNTLSPSSVEKLELEGVDAAPAGDSRTTAMLIEAVKEQKAEIQELKSQLGKLSARLNGRTELARR